MLAQSPSRIVIKVLPTCGAWVRKASKRRTFYGPLSAILMGPSEDIVRK